MMLFELLTKKLAAVWEGWVKAAHLFLSENEIGNINSMLPKPQMVFPLWWLQRMKTESQWALWALQIKSLKCYSFQMKAEDREWEKSCWNMVLKIIQSISLQSMNKTILQKAFTSIWALRFIKERSWTNREIHIRYCIWKESEYFRFYELPLKEKRGTPCNRHQSLANPLGAERLRYKWLCFAAWGL